MQALDNGLEPIVVLTIGTALVVAATGLVCWFVRSSVWQRTAWQVAVVATLVLLTAEFTGFGGAIVRLAGAKIDSPPTGGSKAIAAGTSDSRRTMPEQGPALKTVAQPAPSSRSPVQVSPLNPLQFGDVAGTARPLSTTGDLLFASQFNADWEEALAASAEPVVLDESIAEAVSLPPALPQGESTVEIKPSQPPAFVAATTPASVDAASPVATADPRIPWWPVGLWTLGVAIFAGGIVRSQIMLSIFRRRHTKSADVTIYRRVQRLARRLGIHRTVRVLQAETLKSPVAFGTWRPTVVLPASFAEEFGSDQQEAMLAHELAHLAGWDPAWQLASDLVCAVLWWHPAAWWSRRRLRSANESVADEASLLVPDGPGALADCLLAIGRRLARRQRLGWVPFEGPGFRSSLGRRVQRLLSLPKRSPRAVSRGRLALARTALPLTLVFVIVLCTAWIRPQASQAEGETTMSVLTNSWRRSLAAMAFVALASPMSNDAAADDPLDGTMTVVLQDGDRERGDREHADHEAREREERRENEARERRENEEREHREMEERERRENEERERRRHMEELEGELRGLREKAEHIERKIGGRNPEEAPDLHHALREIHGRMEEIERHEVEARLGELGRHRVELAKRSEEIQREMREMQAAQRETHEEMQRVEREIRETMRHVEGRREAPPREEFARRIGELKRKIAELNEAGRHDEAERLKRKGHEMVERFKAAHRDRPDRERFDDRPDRPHPGPPEAIRHVQEQINEMRGEMHEMRQLLKELVRQRRER